MSKEEEPRCPHCKRHCPLSDPHCKKGEKYAEEIGYTKGSNKKKHYDAASEGVEPLMKNEDFRNDRKHKNKDKNDHDQKNHSDKDHDYKERNGKGHDGKGRGDKGHKEKDHNKKGRFEKNHDGREHGGKHRNKDHGLYMFEHISLENMSSDERLLHMLQRGAHYMKHKKGFKRGQTNLLLLLQEHGSLTQRELQDFAGIRSSSMSELIGKLESEGVIKRTKDNDDQRNKIISLTEEGIALCNAEKQKFRQGTEELFTALSTDEKAQLESLMTKLLDSWKVQNDSEDKNESEEHKESQETSALEEMNELEEQSESEE